MPTTVCRICGEADRPTRKWRRVCRRCERIAAKVRRQAIAATIPATPITSESVQVQWPLFVCGDR